MERGRFAPTPSGALHIGSARTALASALAVWSRGGVWILRVEDIDIARTPTDATATMLEDLAWLGLRWDEGPVVSGPHAPYLQSRRGTHYAAALRQLIAQRRVYPCACSRREVEQSVRAPHGVEAVYPGTCRNRDPEDVTAEARARGRGVSWRFRVDTPEAAVTWHDAIVGECAQDVAREVGDFVVCRSDGVPAYQLAVVVDDQAMEVTEVLRGDDLAGSTGRQILLHRVLGTVTPRWAHIPLVLSSDGERMAKRLGSMALRSLREAGVSPDALRHTLLETLGVTAPDRPLHDIARTWTLADIPKSSVCWTPGAHGGTFETRRT